ncbi:integral membrane protein, YjbE family [Paenibacillus algicola]|uniref:Integral membrane protein, YjbE family n=1 Tax=Paenibacillus algicola TaxID=2565926 RepID=A0A4P8XI05_9BACL|nr:TerC family protein [Paenibacillus algicola]QCT02207.1 integral membrane protein, YjbE family [Paenibacillus algicola]
MDTMLLLGQILMINLVLSGDNALVIAMASRDLPEQERRQAIWIGTAGAVILRCLLTFVAVLLLNIPYLQAAGALLLLWIAFKLIKDQQQEHGDLREPASMWGAVYTILAADFVMSLDNVIAIAGLAKGDLALMVIGIVLSIPIVVWGSGIISSLLARFPLLLYLGAGVLAYTAGEMLLNDSKTGVLILYWLPAIHALVPLLLACAVIAAGGMHGLRHKKA